MAALRAPLTRLRVLGALGRARTGPPDFVGVGTMWAGTPWWTNVVQKHPDVERRPRSQQTTAFFQPFCERAMTDADVAAYHGHFPRRPGKITGEWSQRYISDFWVPPLLRRAAPEAKLLVLLSDPFERYRRKLAAELALRPPENAAYYMSETVTRGRYASQLHGLWEHFDREQVLVLQYEKCRLDPVAEYRRTMRFLGVRDDFEPFTRLRTRAATAVRLLLARAQPTMEFWPDLENALRDELEDEMAELARVVPDLDLGLWPAFRHLSEARERAMAPAP